MKIETEQDVKERLRMLNIEAGTRITMLKKAFFGSTVLVEADGVRAGMRKELAEKIFVKVSETEMEKAFSGSALEGGTKR